MKEKTFASAVVYIYNAESLIESFLLNLDKTLAEKFELYEIVLVNDRSNDHTTQVIKSIAVEIKGTLAILNLAWRHKRELAMLAGTDLAIGDFVYEFESVRRDYDWTLIADLYDKSVTGYDVVYAYPKGATKRKSRIFYNILNHLSHLRVDPHTESVKIISRKALNRVLLDRGKVRYRKVLYMHCGFPATSLEYTATGKTNSADELTLLNKLALASDVFIVFSNIGTQIAMLFSAVSMLLSLAIGFYALIAYLTGNTTISGWTTTMLFLAIGFSGIFLTLTVIAKYISTILMEQRQRQLYTVESINKLNTLL